MKKILTIFIAISAFMSCRSNQNENSVLQDGSITMNLYYTGVGGNARKFVEEMEASGTADAIRTEEGNLRYDYFFSAADPETVLLIDMWASQEALDAHHATPMMQTIIDLREKYDLHMSAERYFRAGQDVTAADKAFIRH